jgi:hypothetical protein
VKFKDLYEDAETGQVGGSVPGGSYDVVVSGARTLPDSSLIFLSLTTLNGPTAGTEVDVSLYFPGEGSKRGARIFFAKKIAGFVSYPDVKGAFMAADGAPDLASGLQLIADALGGKRVTAEITLRTEGEYAGSNELRSTKPLEAGATPTQAAPAQPAEAAAPAAAATGGVPF